MSQQSSQHKNLTPAIGIALAFLLSMSSLAGCSASMAADEAPTDESTPELVSTGAPDDSQEPQATPAEDANQQNAEAASENRSATDDGVLSYRDIPAFDGNPYVYVNDGEPVFTDDQRAAEPGMTLRRAGRVRPLHRRLRRRGPRDPAHGEARFHRRGAPLRLADGQVRFRGGQVPVQSLPSSGYQLTARTPTSETSSPARAI